MRFSKVIDFFENKVAYCQGRGYVPSLQKELEFSSSLLSKEPILAIDIGGNVGEYSEAMLEKYPRLEVHIFEPSAKNVDKLKLKFLGDSRVRIVPEALSEESGEGILYADFSGSGMSSLECRRLDHFNINFSSQEKIKKIRFEDYWKSNLSSAEIDLVKLDVEGHELSVLKGFGSAILTTKLIQFEFGGTCIDSRVFFQDYWYFFRDINFSLYRITPLGLKRINKYMEIDESFTYSNYIALNNNFIK